MSRNHHYIKINPRYFVPIASGEKTFEVRYNDRDYKVNDILHLQEYADGEYTGRQIDAEVTYLLDDLMAEMDEGKDFYVVSIVSGDKDIKQLMQWVTKIFKL